MDTATEIEAREDNDGNSAFYNTRTQVWGWTREEVEENIEERVGEDGVMQVSRRSATRVLGTHAYGVISKRRSAQRLAQSQHARAHPGA